MLWPLVLLAVLLTPLFSGYVVGRTHAAHCASDGSVEPGGFVVKCAGAAVCGAGGLVVVARGAGVGVDAVVTGVVAAPLAEPVVVTTGLAAFAAGCEQAPMSRMTRADVVSSAARPLIRVTQRP
jgi:hypothetical protein